VAERTIYTGIGKPFPPVAAFLEKRFQKLYQSSKVAIYTSAEMREKLGSHPCAPILYPCSAPRDPNFVPDFKPPSGNRPLKHPLFSDPKNQGLASPKQLHK
jgi:hypothetical protein